MATKKEQDGEQTEVPGTETPKILGIEKAAKALRELLLEGKDRLHAIRKRKKALQEALDTAGLRVYRCHFDPKMVASIEDNEPSVKLRSKPIPRAEPMPSDGEPQ